MWNKPKKNLGQHLLKNVKILEVMVHAAELSKKDVVLEVGPGTGSLTDVLAKHAKKVVAIEKDVDLIPILKEKFRDYKNVEIIKGDILNLTPKGVRSGLLQKKHSYKIVANIPYYITGKFLRMFLSNHKLRPGLMVLMVQKEVAERILAKDGKSSLLSLSVRAYGNPEIIRVVPRGAFSPPPKADSAVIKISNISDRWFKKNKINEKTFFGILRSAFQQKRKMLRQSLGKKIILSQTFAVKRPEELSLENWLQIFIHNQSPSKN